MNSSMRAPPSALSLMSAPRVYFRGVARTTARCRNHGRAARRLSHPHPMFTSLPLFSHLRTSASMHAARPANHCSVRPGPVLARALASAPLLFDPPRPRTGVTDHAVSSLPADACDRVYGGPYGTADASTQKQLPNPVLVCCATLPPPSRPPLPRFS